MKNFLFTYIVYKLDKWYKEENNISNNENNFSLLKIMKLLFFVVTASIEIDKSDNKSSNLLINNDKKLNNFLFDKFSALPLGHVESEIYNNIKSKELQNFVEITIEKSSIIENLVNVESEIYNQGLIDLKQIIDGSIEFLKNKNSKLILESHSQLIDLSHKHFSWVYYFDMARKFNKSSQQIPNDIIIKEHKFFS